MFLAYARWLHLGMKANRERVLGMDIQYDFSLHTVLLFKRINYQLQKGEREF